MIDVIYLFIIKLSIGYYSKPGIMTIFKVPNQIFQHKGHRSLLLNFSSVLVFMCVWPPWVACIASKASIFQRYSYYKFWREIFIIG